VGERALDRLRDQYGMLILPCLQSAARELAQQEASEAGVDIGGEWEQDAYEKILSVLERHIDHGS